jgi:hypothetical protein
LKSVTALTFWQHFTTAINQSNGEANYSSNSYFTCHEHLKTMATQKKRERDFEITAWPIVSVVSNSQRNETDVFWPLIKYRRLTTIIVVITLLDMEIKNTLHFTPFC